MKMEVKTMENNVTLQQIGYRSFSFRVRQFSDAMTKDIIAMYKKRGVELELHHITVMALLFEHSGLTNRMLAEATGLSKPSITQTVSRLVTDKFIMEKPSGKDKRRKHLYLSTKGMAFMNEIMPILTAADTVFKQLSQEIGQDVLAIMDKLENALSVQSIEKRFENILGE